MSRVYKPSSALADISCGASFSLSLMTILKKVANVEFMSVSSKFFLIQIFLATVFTCYIFPYSAHASQSLGCESTDKSLHIEYMQIEGDGLYTLLGDFAVSYKGKKTQPGLFNWFKWNGTQFTLTVFSMSGRQVHILATSKTKDYGLLRIASGFIFIEGTMIDLQGVEFSCEEG